MNFLIAYYFMVYSVFSRFLPPSEIVLNNFSSDPLSDRAETLNLFVLDDFLSNGVRKFWKKNPRDPLDFFFRKFFKPFFLINRLTRVEERNFRKKTFWKKDNGLNFEFSELFFWISSKIPKMHICEFSTIELVYLFLFLKQLKITQ